MQGPPETDAVPAAQRVQVVAAFPVEVVPAAHAAHVPLTRYEFGAHMGGGLEEGDGVAEGAGA